MILCTLVFLAVDMKNEHVAHVYVLGVCEVSHRTFKSCPGVTCFTENVEDLPKTLSPWWHSGSQKLQKWPKKPEKLTYELVHEYCESEPYCTYVLIHPVSVAVSGLGKEDLGRFKHAYVTTQVI